MHAHRGRGRQTGLTSVSAELPQAELDALLMETVSPVGQARHLRPVVQLSETPGGWSRPPAPLGYHAAEWPPRGS
ncbi:MAG: hypothetical protein EPO27_09750 [Betaproteobacteria bacterium]|nr:MAG: hypothetical protein EPO27_09750 [Betaproteobacteria bacterium]